jgi:lysozyme family protein
MLTPAEIISAILRAEGEKFTANPQDSGGPTKWGITQKSLSEFFGRPATVEDVRSLTADTARRIYLQRFYLGPRLDLLMPLSPAVVAEVMDTGVNTGVVRAVTMLQRLLNGLNSGGALWPDIAADGQCGPGTANALRAFLAHRGAEGERVLVVGLNALQGAFYVELAERREKDESFLYGWLRERVAAQVQP